MPQIDLTLPHHRYAIRIESGLLRDVGDGVRQVAAHDRAAMIVDAAVADSHGKLAGDSLRAAGFDLLVCSMSSSERNKGLETVRDLYGRLLDHGFERRSPVVAVGGGVVGDTAGFVAATVLRGVPFIQCPTTLLSMVDASVGGKVGVNVPQGKNLVGAFHQPHRVFADTDTLSTLPARQLRCGLAECVKHAVIRDDALFQWTADHLDRILALDTAVLAVLVERNVRIKAGVVMQDEKEAGERALLNFGHTFGHAIEWRAAQDSGSDLHHGEAVSLGMVAASHLAREAGLCDADVPERLSALLQRIGLPTRASLPPVEQLMQAMRSDKKMQHGKLRLVLPKRIGEAVVVGETDEAAIVRAWERIRV